MSFTESAHTGEYILSEANGHRSRENVTVVEEQTLVAGTILGLVTASGKYTALDLGASDGSEDPTAILLAGVTTGTGEEAVVAVHARDCEVNQGCLTYPDGASAGDIADVNTALAAFGIIVRTVS